MKSKIYFEQMPEAEKRKLLKEAKMGTWYDGWKPYCLNCSTAGRMTLMPYGFKCEGNGDWFGRRGCGNMIGFDLERLIESPLNK